MFDHLILYTWAGVGACGGLPREAQDLSTTYPQLIHSLFYGPSTAYPQTYAHVIHTQRCEILEFYKFQKFPIRNTRVWDRNTWQIFKIFHIRKEHPRIAKF